MDTSTNSTINDNNTALSKIAREFLITDIESAMSELSKENYIIFSMHMEGYCYREIGEYTQIKKGAIKTRIHHICQQLKRTLHIYK